MITIDDIIRYSKPHPIGFGRQTRLQNNKVMISITGGNAGKYGGMYGNFIDSFEMAILDKETRNFVTKYYITECLDDVSGYMTKEDVEQYVNMILGNNFQVL